MNDYQKLTNVIDVFHKNGMTINEAFEKGLITSEVITDVIGTSIMVDDMLKDRVLISCPDNIPGCLVAHFAPIEEVLKGCSLPSPISFDIGPVDNWQCMECGAMAPKCLCLLSDKEKIPNIETREVLEASAKGINVIRFDSVDALFQDLENNEK